jgi:hypothetical protein
MSSDDSMQTIQVRQTLANIRTKIEQCEQLYHVLNQYESNYALFHDKDYTIEESIVKLYYDLKQICKEKDIL